MDPELGQPCLLIAMYPMVAYLAHLLMQLGVNGELCCAYSMPRMPGQPCNFCNSRAWAGWEESKLNLSFALLIIGFQLLKCE